MNFINQLYKKFLERPKLILVTLILIFSFSVYNAKNFQLDASADSLLLENDPDLNYLRSVNERYSSEEFFVITYSPKKKVNAESLKELKKFVDEINNIKWVSKSISVLNAPLFESSDLPLIEKIKKLIEKSGKEILLIGNGDVVSMGDAREKAGTYGCDGVMIGRGAVDNPWIFKQTRHFLNTGEILPPPTIQERVRVCLEHLQHSCQVKQCRKPVFAFRKHYAGYLKGVPNISHLRKDLMQIETLDDAIARLQAFAKECAATS
jgi:hypothetical protein